MQNIFKVGSTYTAYGEDESSTIRVKILERNADAVTISCKALFPTSDEVRFIYLDDDDNEYFNLNQYYTVNSMDIDQEYSSVNEAKMIQDEILREPIYRENPYGMIQDLIIDETDEGVRFTNYTKYQPKQQNLYNEEWSPSEAVREKIMVAVENIVWYNAPANYPSSCIIGIEEDVLGTDDEAEAVQRGVMEELRRKAYFYFVDEQASIVSYELHEVPQGNDFDPSEEIGFNGGWR